MASQKMSVSKIFMWILMGLLFVGLAGFGATNLSGSNRVMGNVGDKDITVDRYARLLQQEIRGITAQTGQPFSFQQAQQAGIPDRVLAQIVTARALDHEADTLGLSIGDERLAAQVSEIEAFRGASGEFNRESYRFALQNIGMSESEFEADLRDESARNLLQGAVLAGNTMPDAYTNTLIDYALERRNIQWAVIDGGGLDTGDTAPSDADLTAFYEANIASYTAPEKRNITYAWITPDMILDTVEVDEALMRQSYEDRAAEFNQPERRLVERLVFPDDAAASAALGRITSGESSFETEVTARGLDLLDTDLGDVTRVDLADAADTVFGGDVGAVVGPAPSPFGPALFRINAALPAQVTSFEDAREALRADLALDRARRVIQSMAEGNEDLLAGGATLEELANDTEMQLGTLDFFSGSDDPIAAYPAFRQAAARVTDSDFPTIANLGDGGLFALRLNDIVPPAPIPLAEIRDEVEAAWQRNARERRLTEQAQALADRLNEGAQFASLDLPRVETTEGIARGDRVDGLTPTVVEEVFNLSPGQAIALPFDGRSVLVQVTDVLDADRDSEDAQALARALRGQAAADLSQDIFNALATDIQRRAGIQINEQARTAVHVNFQ